MDSRKEQLRQTVCASLGIAVIMVAVYTDIKSELKFTEDARNGVHERAVTQVASIKLKE